MQNIGKKLEIFVIVAAIALIGIIYAFKQSSIATPVIQHETQNQPSAPERSSILPPDSLSTDLQTSLPPARPSVIEYKGQDGKTALELLQAEHIQVGVKHYSFGDMVVTIDGVTPDSKHFWAMYVNGQFSQVGASAYSTKSTDTIKWQVEEVKNQ